eukprot:139373-Prymnesium_polylepis.3
MVCHPEKAYAVYTWSDPPYEGYLESSPPRTPRNRARALPCSVRARACCVRSWLPTGDTPTATATAPQRRPHEKRVYTRK